MRERTAPANPFAEEHAEFCLDYRRAIERLLVLAAVASLAASAACSLSPPTQDLPTWSVSRFLYPALVPALATVVAVPAGPKLRALALGFAMTVYLLGLGYILDYVMNERGGPLSYERYGLQIVSASASVAAVVLCASATAWVTRRSERRLQLLAFVGAGMVLAALYGPLAVAFMWQTACFSLDTPCAI